MLKKNPAERPGIAEIVQFLTNEDLFVEKRAVEK
jgi:hypothetical protein